MAKRFGRKRIWKGWEKNHQRQTDAQKRNHDQKEKKKKKDWWGKKDEEDE